MESASTDLRVERPPRPTRLVAIVSVSEDNCVQCQEAGCGRPIHAAVHIIEDAGQLIILGSSCFANRYGSLRALGAAGYGSGSGRRLTDAEHLLLKENTQALLEYFRQEELAKEHALRRSEPVMVHPALPPPPAALPALRVSFEALVRPQRVSAPRTWTSPWPWQKPLTSILLMQAPSGDRWIRVQHQDGSQKLVPWPKFPGWEAALPDGIGVPDPTLGVLAVSDIVSALAKLRAMGFSDRVGDRKEVMGKQLFTV